MSRRPKRNYTPEFRIEAAQLVVDQDYTVRESEGSAGARSIAQMATSQGVPLSRFRASRLMKKLGLISCQIPGHTYKKTGDVHVEILNYLDRISTMVAKALIKLKQTTGITINRWPVLLNHYTTNY